MSSRHLGSCRRSAGVVLARRRARGASRAAAAPRDPLAAVRRGRGRLDVVSSRRRTSARPERRRRSSSRRPPGSSSRAVAAPSGWQLDVSDDGVATWTGGRIEDADVVSFPLEVTARTRARERDLPGRPALRRRRDRALGGDADRRPGDGRRRAAAARSAAPSWPARSGLAVIAVSLVLAVAPAAAITSGEIAETGATVARRALRADPERRPGMRLVPRGMRGGRGGRSSSIRTSRSSRSSPRPSGSTSASCGRSRRTRTPTTSPATAASPLDHGVPVTIHAAAGAAYPHDPLADGDELEVGNVVLRCIHTPGHRPEHCCLAVVDTTRADEPWLVLTGDSLFVGDAARPDLAVGATEGAEGLFHSLRRLLELPDGVEVFPGHVAGSLCGTAMSSRGSTTIGFERRFNPMLALSEVGRVHRGVRRRLGAEAAEPRAHRRAEPVGVPSAPRPTVPELAAPPDGSQLLDVRPVAGPPRGTPARRRQRPRVRHELLDEGRLRPRRRRARDRPRVRPRRGGRARSGASARSRSRTSRATSSAAATR